MKALLFILLLISSPLMAIENEFLFRVGMAVVGSTAKNKDESTKVQSVGMAITYSRIFTKWEFGISTHIYAGSIDDFYLEENGENLSGDGTLTTQSYSLFAKRFFEIYPIKYWRLYATAGPAFVFHTVKLRNFVASTPEFTHNHKVTYDSVGIKIAAGIEEHALRKKSRPNYLQISYSLHKPTKFRVIDATDFTKVESIYESNNVKDVVVHQVLLEIGFLLF